MLGRLHGLTSAAKKNRLYFYVSPGISLKVISGLEALKFVDTVLKGGWKYYHSALFMGAKILIKKDIRKNGIWSVTFDNIDRIRLRGDERMRHSVKR
ncbi:hypothetical protein DS909_07855 [Phaeobacter gallaeciensis]|uniref:Uncharacterized protein n=1 Tax=Phaeobacter gallaeciensis TaxID=60890 RepID=A0A366X1B0_9RHOB|nr:hypothetical protein DS909_07855 [Phaeobacter gallaeciensis]